MTASHAGQQPQPRRSRSVNLGEVESLVVTSPVLSEGESQAAAEILGLAAVSDGRQAVSEQGRLRLKASEPRVGIVHLLQSAVSGRQGSQRADVGYAQLESPGAGKAGTAELAVAPGRRGEGFGRELVEAVLAAAAEAEPGGAVEFWAHGGHPAARHLAQTYGAQLVRELRQMRRPSTPAGVAEELPRLPEGVTVRAFRPDRDGAEWLRLNALAFAHHPEQGAWTEQDLADRVAEPWFDPEGFFLAVRGEGAAERVVGFHWTKVHPEGLGEVYVVGVDPAEQGNGLGRALTAIGLRYLAQERKQETVMLYVDADNAAAVRVYERLGFTVHEIDLMYRVAGERPGA
ncbi:mycothiol acetyltransferase [Kitasatospora sp. MMS16-BH015]|uniref:mycothiol synthase n=1 Tax=Kitasatospora sp. MMS16-BH015 TaxID=2018025 RepID=UPI000CA30D1F|nr:mycothiol synthase [Kitasatospora sp. MMS16-BH015]AUG79043.1 mycothiol acetyltransferase [Kitasatospora sp. MMS16-BH015]